MANKSEPVDIDRSKATLLEPGEPIEAPSYTQSGGTFAERAKARAATEKRVRADDVQDKAVAPKKAATKTRKKS